MKALITGITGQDGYYLSNNYLKKAMKFTDWLEEPQVSTQAESIH